MLEDADVGEIPVFSFVIEAVADDEFIADFKADVIGFDFLGARFVLGEEHSGVDGGGAFVRETFRDCGEGAPGIEDVIEEEDVHAIDFGEMTVEEIDFSGALESAVIAGDIQALDGELAGDAAEKIGGEDEGAFEQDDHDDGSGGEFNFDLAGHGIEAFLDDGFVHEDAFDIVFHGGRNGLGGVGCQVGNKGGEESEQIGGCSPLKGKKPLAGKAGIADKHV